MFESWKHCPIKHKGPKHDPDEVPNFVQDQ